MADSKMDFKPIGAITEETVSAGAEDSESNEPVRTTTDQGGDMVTLKSLCMNCHEQGTTRLLLTKIPFFRDIILMAFECEECGFRSSEVQSAGMQDKGCRFECRVESTRDLSRQLVKGDKASFSIPELDFEIPAGTQGGVFTTIEGILDRALENLEQTQPVRRAYDAAGADAVDGFIAKLRTYRDGSAFPFTVVLDDPAGNSFLENPVAPQKDPKLKAKHYTRSKAQNEALGLFAENRGLGVIQEGEEQDGAGEEQSAAGGGTDGGMVAVGPDAPIEDEDYEAEALAGSGAKTVFRNAAVDLEGAARAYAEALASQAGSGHLSTSQLAARQRRAGGAAAAADGNADTDAAAQAQYEEEKAAAKAQLEAEAAAHEALKARLRAEAKAMGATEAKATGAAAAQAGAAGAAGKGKKHVDMSGNVPGGFKKGGALIQNQTERNALTEAEAERAGVHRDATGRLHSLVFESSVSSHAKEIMTFQVPCHACGSAGEVRMTVTDVPHFKEIILMSYDCEDCGWRNVEVKGGGAVPDHGTVTELSYTPGQPWSEDDMIRDVIKGDTAAVEVPELELELDAGSLGGMYTTVEGLLNAIKDKLIEGDPFMASAAAAGHANRVGTAMAGDGAGGGDSADPVARSRMAEFLTHLDECIAGTRAFTLRMRDPMANSWIYSPYAGSDKEDPRLSHQPYIRSHDEDLDLGLLDMNAPRDEAEEEQA